MKDQTIKVSIILPTYNGGRYLAASLDSCLGQSFQDWELIIVDDGSTDETPEIIAAYTNKDRRLRSLRNAVNRKLPAALNRGFAAARGRYFTWTCDDNLYRRNALEIMAARLDRNPAIDYVYSDFSLIDAAGRTIKRITAAGPQCLATRNHIGPCRLYRRRVHELLGGYDEELFLVEDYDFALRAMCLVKMESIHMDLYAFRLHDRALTATHADAVPYARDRMKEKNLPLLKSYDRRLAAACHASLIDPALRRGEIGRARRHALMALRCTPIHAVLSSGRLLLSSFLRPTA